jgi:hypothetical protein
VNWIELSHNGIWGRAVWTLGYAVAQLRHCSISRKVAGSSPDYVIGFSIVIIISAALWTWDRFLDGADKLIIFIYRLSRILEASPPPWKPRGLSRLVQGLLYLFL